MLLANFPPSRSAAPSVDFRNSRARTTRLLQRGRCIPTTTLRRPRLRARCRAHRAKCRRFAPAFRSAGIRRRYNGGDFPDLDVFCAEADRGPGWQTRGLRRRLSEPSYGGRGHPVGLVAPLHMTELSRGSSEIFSIAWVRPRNRQPFLKPRGAPRSCPVRVKNGLLGKDRLWQPAQPVDATQAL